MLCTPEEDSSSLANYPQEDQADIPAGYSVPASDGSHAWADNDSDVEEDNVSVADTACSDMEEADEQGRMLENHTCMVYSSQGCAARHWPRCGNCPRLSW
jgi:hypothetical protein